MTSPIDLSDYYSGGYFLIRAGNPGWEQLKTPLLPEKLISLSNCISQKLEVSWGWSPGSPEEAQRFGIPSEKLAEFLEWCRHGHTEDLGIFSMFYSTAAARRFIHRFLSDTTELYIVGVGLPKELEQANWQEPSDEHTPGIEKYIEQHLPLEAGGEILGFEVVSFSYGSFGHSWLCSHLHEDMHQLYGIEPKRWGLIDSYADAKKVYDWIAEDEMKGTRAEPEPYDFWLLVSYPFTE